GANGASAGRAQPDTSRTGGAQQLRQRVAAGGFRLRGEHCRNDDVWPGMRGTGAAEQRAARGSDAVDAVVGLIERALKERLVTLGLAACALALFYVLFLPKPVPADQAPAMPLTTDLVPR